MEKRRYPINNVTYLRDKKKISVELPILCVNNNPTHQEVNLLKNKKIRLATSKKIFYRLLAKKLQKHSSKNIIIDNGCGTNILREFTNKKLIGVDYRVRNAYSPIDFVADSMHLPIKDNYVDCYASNFLMEYVKPEEYIGEMHRTLKKGGVAYVSFFTPYSYLGFFISVGTYYNYLKKIKNEPIRFLKNPIKHILYGFTRGIKDKTFIGQMKRWKLCYFEDVFRKVGFRIIKKEFVGNLLSMDLIYNPISSRLRNCGKRGVICLYTLKK